MTPLEIPKEILEALVKKDTVSKRAWYKRIETRWRAVNCAYDKKIIALSFIIDKRLDPRPFSNSEERSKLGELKKDLGSLQTTQSTPSRMKATTRRITKVHEVKISPTIGKLPLNLGAKTMAKGKEMAQIYYVFWVFENSLRQFILDTMEKHYGSGWWPLHVSSKTQKRASGRQTKNRENRWHSTRGAHEIYYIDISDYKGIITKNWTVFESVFSGLPRPQEWILNRIDEITLSRNIVAHMNPLEKDDIERVTIYLKDWLKQIK